VLFSLACCKLLLAPKYFGLSNLHKAAEREWMIAAQAVEILWKARFVQPEPVLVGGKVAVEIGRKAV
jgi:hypothetical protein